MHNLEASLGHYDVIRLLSLRYKSYIEIGVKDGGSLLAAIDTGLVNHVVLCDTWGSQSGGSGRGNHNHISKLLDDKLFCGQVTFIDRSSQTVGWDNYPDCGFANIDGSHILDDAYRDMIAIWPKVKAMVIHDISFPSVWGAVLKFTTKVDLSKSRCTLTFGDTSTMVLEKVV